MILNTNKLLDILNRIPDEFYCLGDHLGAFPISFEKLDLSNINPYERWTMTYKAGDQDIMAFYNLISPLHPNVSAADIRSLGERFEMGLGESPVQSSSSRRPTVHAGIEENPSLIQIKENKKLTTIKDLKEILNNYPDYIIVQDLSYDKKFKPTTFIAGIGLNTKKLEINKTSIDIGKAVVFNLIPKIKREIYKNTNCDFSLFQGPFEKYRPKKYTRDLYQYLIYEKKREI